MFFICRLNLNSKLIDNNISQRSRSLCAVFLWYQDMVSHEMSNGKIFLQNFILCCVVFHAIFSLISVQLRTSKADFRKIGKTKWLFFGSWQTKKINFFSTQTFHSIQLAFPAFFTFFKESRYLCLGCVSHSMPRSSMRKGTKSEKSWEWMWFAFRFVETARI